MILIGQQLCTFVTLHPKIGVNVIKKQSGIMASRERRDSNIELYISTATIPLEYFFLILLGDVTNREE